MDNQFGDVRFTEIKNVVQEDFGDLATITVYKGNKYPVIKISPNKFRQLTIWDNNKLLTYPIKVYPKSYKITRILGALQSYKQRIIEITKQDQLIWLYRESGYIPNHIAKKHGQKLKKCGIERHSNRSAWINMVYEMAFNYLTTYGTCIYCGGKKQFQEVLDGVLCTNCRKYVLHDIM